MPGLLAVYCWQDVIRPLASELTNLTGPLMIGPMRLSTRGEYGLLALVDLAMYADDRAVQARDISQRQGIPKQYLDQLLLSLKKSGFVASSRGRNGGYRLARPASKMSLLEIVSALEGPMKNSNFQFKARRGIRVRETLRSIWEDAWKRSTSMLEDVTLEEVSARCRSDETTLMYYI